MAHRSINGSTTGGDGLTRFDRTALGLAVGWLVVVSLFFLILPPGVFTDAGFDSLRFVMLLVAIFMPVMMIAVVAFTQAKKFRRCWTTLGTISIWLPTPRRKRGLPL